ncbi:MAG: protein translocase subunit SecF [Deltaproteobacteria bacterium]|jgi:preprotein translocase subunit SecF|nr:protein translocase subunit SecF [Deltaproteobacteria bacterium]
MGFHFIPKDTKIDFVGMRRFSYVFSIFILLAGLASLFLKGGPIYGIDFAGGAVVQVYFNQPISDEEVKKSMEKSSLPNIVVQQFGEDDRGYLLRLADYEGAQSLRIRAAVEQALAEGMPGVKYEIQRLEMVGPKVGADLRAGAVEALFYATLLISVYLSGRFEQRWTAALLMTFVLVGGISGGVYILEFLGLSLNRGFLILAAAFLAALFCWKLKLAFALGAMASIVHDLLISIGVFSILDKEFDLTIIAALLTVVGYSLNDTIIVFDRIRENLRNNAVRKEGLAAVINRSVNQTLSRTILTSATTMLVVLALLVLGGGIIHDFALLLCVGILVGTYSSIFVASPVLLFFEKNISYQVAREQDEAAKEAVRKRNRRLPQV